MLILPDDIEQYTDKDGKKLAKDELPIVDAVRMSMSYPYLFDPVTLYKGGRPHYIVDGGLLSNFPVWLFDSPKPKRPTWGFRLHGGADIEEGLPYRTLPRPLWQVPLMKAMFFSAMEAWDRRLLGQATATRSVSIPTRDVATTDFGLTRKRADDLYRWGYEEGRRFFREQREYVNSFGESPASAALPPTVRAGS
jgi:NTE family protein